MKWKLNAVNIKTAFFQGDKIDREIYVMPLKEANTTNVWQLRKVFMVYRMPHVNGKIDSRHIFYP